MPLKNWQEIVARAAAEIELWWLRQCHDVHKEFSWWYMESSPEHDGGFLIAEEAPANNHYFFAGVLGRHFTKEQNLYKFLDIARRLPILAWPREGGVKDQNEMERSRLSCRNPRVKDPKGGAAVCLS